MPAPPRSRACPQPQRQWTCGSGPVRARFEGAKCDGHPEEHAKHQPVAERATEFRNVACPGIFCPRSRWFRVGDCLVRAHRSQWRVKPELLVYIAKQRIAREIVDVCMRIGLPEDELVVSVGAEERVAKGSERPLR